MPITLNTVTVSGQTDPTYQSQVIVTYDSNLLGYAGYPNTGNLDNIPGFLFLQGDVQYRQGSDGNMRAINPNKDGSLPT